MDRLSRKTNTGSQKQGIFRRVSHFLGWTRFSYALVSLFVMLVLLIVIVWWPLVNDYFSQINPDYPIWAQLDWLLIGIFLFMSLAVMAGANLQRDAFIVIVGICGGLVIESWGTQTRLWTYFTHERPPLWIIPAWPIASLTIDRMVKIILRISGLISEKEIRRMYYLALIGFMVLMLFFVWPTIHKSMTILAVISCVLLIMSPGNYRTALATFIAGSCLGYFLEVWGTTRLCWTYYTNQTPPFFAVLAHGLAGFSFWRAGLLLKLFWEKARKKASNENIFHSYLKE